MNRTIVVVIMMIVLVSCSTPNWGLRQSCESKIGRCWVEGKYMMTASVGASPSLEVASSQARLNAHKQLARCLSVDFSRVVNIAEQSDHWIYTDYKYGHGGQRYYRFRSYYLMKMPLQSSVIQSMPVNKHERRIEYAQKAPARQYRAGDTKTVGGIELVYIPSGSFMMGVTDGEGNDDEHPRHKVTVNGFWMGKYEVTQGQFERLMGRNPSRFNGGWFSSNPDHPVEQVNWYDAVEFCNVLSRIAGLSSAYKIDKMKKDHQNKSHYDGLKWTVSNVPESDGFRLPYEAEWEYACRAGTSTQCYWGDLPKGKYCWSQNNSGETTHEVGKKLPNAFGLYDMCGNVQELCMDWYNKNYYLNSPEMNPKGPICGEYRVNRGLDWTSHPNIIISARRSLVTPDTRYLAYGFRVVLPAR